MFALVDVNSFTPPARRRFGPTLRETRGGRFKQRRLYHFTFSRSKALGIGMAGPYFKLKDELRRQKVHVFSSNYALYADMSRRVMTILEEMAPRVEITRLMKPFWI